MDAPPGSFADRVAGALALSALGDALGLPNEARGLRGEISPWPDENDDPWPLPVADTFREPESNPWNIWAPPEVTAGMRGVVSDDTAIKIVLIEPWLADARARGATPDEDDFIAWLRRRPPEAEPWREAMAAEQARQWIDMFAGSTHDAACDPDEVAPCFYRPGEPVCFGPFLYLETALLDTGLSAPDVFRKFTGFCCLDQDHGHAITGMLAAWLCAVGRDGPQRPLLERWDETFTQIDAAEKLSPWRTKVLHDARWVLAGATPTSRPDVFLDIIKRHLFELAPAECDHSLKAFDPQLQLAQMLACLSFSGGDGLLAMRLLAHGAGDTDTLAATLGLIVGAHLGYWALLNSPAGGALQVVEETTGKLFDRSLAQRVAVFTGHTNSKTLT